MRCRNCGWDNPANNTKCEKCNQQLSGNETHYQESIPDRGADIDFNPKKTVNENVVFSMQQNPEALTRKENQCVSCGYPILAEMNSCPNCGKTLRDGQSGVSREQSCSKCGSKSAPDASFCSRCGNPLKATANKGAHNSVASANFRRATVLPGRRSHCSLTMIPEEKERINPVVLSFSGEEIVLNRENTEPENMTITSKEQAVLVYENKRWYIQDKSELKTTFVQASDKVELNPGDIIVLGDRRFEFDY